MLLRWLSAVSHVSSGPEINGMVDWYMMLVDPSTLVGHMSSS